jgi:hypothetical protein
LHVVALFLIRSTIEVICRKWCEVLGIIVIVSRRGYHCLLDLFIEILVSDEVTGLLVAKRLGGGVPRPVSVNLVRGGL